MLVADRFCAFLLILGGMGHAAGSIRFYANDHMALLWALSASLFLFLLGAINLLRSNRPADRPLGWISLAGNLAWLVVIIRFGALIRSFVDFRVLLFLVATIVLTGFSLRGLARSQV